MCSLVKLVRFPDSAEPDAYCAIIISTWSLVNKYLDKHFLLCLGKIFDLMLKLFYAQLFYGWVTRFFVQLNSDHFLLNGIIKQLIQMK